MDPTIHRGRSLRRSLLGRDHGRSVKCANTIGDDDVATIVTIVADDGWKYLSTGAWSDNIDDVVERAKSIIYF